MKAEDYIKAKEQENKRLFGIEMLNIGEAYKAIKMARNEEREKAIDIHMRCCGNFRCPSHYDGFGENICSQNCLCAKHFKELLTK